MKKEKKPNPSLLFSPDFLVSVVEKGLGFVKDNIKIGQKDITIWVNPREGGIAYGADDGRYNLESFFLSLEARDIMETEAHKLGANIFCRFFSGSTQYAYSKQKPIWYYEFNRCAATHENKNAACLLAFAQLIGISAKESDWKHK